MARMPYAETSDAPPAVREALEALPVELGIFRMAAHAPTAFRPFLRFGGAILGELALDPRLRELAILRVARLTPAEYEWVQHVDIALAVGASEEQVAALERDDAQADCFDADEQLVLRFTDEVVRDARASDETFARMRERFGERGIVELVLTIGYYMTVARLLETTGVDLEPAVGAQLAETAARRRDVPS